MAGQVYFQERTWGCAGPPSGWGGISNSEATFKCVDALGGKHTFGNLTDPEKYREAWCFRSNAEGSRMSAGIDSFDVPRDYKVAKFVPGFPDMNNYLIRWAQHLGDGRQFAQDV